MFSATRRLCFTRVSTLLLSNRYNNVVSLADFHSEIASSNVALRSIRSEYVFPSKSKVVGSFNGLSRCMSTSKGRSMRSKVERRMRKESGKTLREIRRAKKIKKKLMTEEERLLYNLKRAKKKVALLLQQLKKYELPELPPPRHDPELLTPEQLQAYKKIGFRNKNYVPVGVRGVFGGVVQNMHLHWKFHETVQVCCDNFPKEKIKEMAIMLARLSGGIVVNVHNVKTIIMFRGRNYRQPKNLIPINTLTKRKALFKARFEQALDSQKLNIKKIEQELRRKGINPEDPVAMASIQRVASTFFNAIDKKEGTPYVFYGDKQTATEIERNMEEEESHSDSDQEELDRFIAEIEDAADRDWVAEEAAEKEELSQIRYRNREEHGGRLRKSDMRTNNSSDDEIEKPSVWRQRDSKQRLYDSEEEDDEHANEEWDSDDGQNANDLDSDADDSDGAHGIVKTTRGAGGRHDLAKNRSFKRNVEPFVRKRMDSEGSEPETMLSDLESAMWQSEEEEEDEEDDMKVLSCANDDYRSNEVDLHHIRKDKKNNKLNDYDSSIDESNEAYEHTDTKRKENRMRKSKNSYNFVSKNTDSGKALWDSDEEDESGTSRPQRHDYWSGSDEDDSRRK
ncbi:CRM-domain containing factor CFM9, mitochondrial, partial [Cucurbita argyrosperma subsp. sororia]